MDLSIAIGVASIAIGAVGYYSTQRARAEVRLRTHRFDWPQIEHAVRALTQRIEHEWKPDLIVCSSAGSVGIIANMYIAYSKRFIPLYLGVSRRNARDSPFASRPIFGSRYTTPRWETFLPSNLIESGAERVLILEDAILTGASVREIVRILTEQGFAEEQIATAAVFVPQLSLLIDVKPRFYWSEVAEPVFEFPWGRSTGKGY